MSDEEFWGRVQFHYDRIQEEIQHEHDQIVYFQGEPKRGVDLINVPKEQWPSKEANKERRERERLEWLDYYWTHVRNWGPNVKLNTKWAVVPE